MPDAPQAWFDVNSPWMGVVPAMAMALYMVGGLPFYAWSRLRHGRWSDGEIEARGDTALLGLSARLYFSWAMRPVWWLVVRSGVPAHAITTLSVLLALAAGVSVATGRFGLGGLLYLLAGCCDFIDGRLARASGKAGAFGAALDSVLDRYCEMAFFSGLAWFYRGSWVLMAVVVAMVGSLMVPYIRARGEALGVPLLAEGASKQQVGLMQRTERILVLGIGALLSPLVDRLWALPATWPEHGVVAAALVLAAIATQFTAMQRLFALLGAIERQSGQPLPRWLAPRSLLRSIIAAAAATAVDFLITLAFVRHAALSPPAATLIGCVFGGLINFAINRLWTFRSIGSYVQQGGRYAFVSASSALLNAGGVAVLALVPGLDFRVAWGIARIAVFLTWNYPLHRDYVFTSADDNVDRAALARNYR